MVTKQVLENNRIPGSSAVRVLKSIKQSIKQTDMKHTIC